jgi:ribosomal protein S18 acetylase RimI-like enzyme
MRSLNSIDVTVIASVHNEEGNLTPLVQRTVAVMNRYPRVRRWELILVDDASADNSWRVMQDLQTRYQRYVRIVQHPQRRGQKGCFMTGFAEARGWLSVLMDADLQVLPEELPQVLDKAIVEGYEMVCTYNDLARGGKRRSPISAIGNLFMKLFFNSPVRDAGGNFMALHTRYMQGVNLIANDQRYLLPICVRRGLKEIGEVGCIFALRAYGKSKYHKWKKALQGIPEMLMLKRRLWRGFYDLPPVPPVERPAQLPGEEIQPAEKELLGELAKVSSGEQRQAILVALAENTHPWSLAQNGRLAALASWRPLPWDSEVLQCPSGAVGGLWAEGVDHLEQLDRLEEVLFACVRDAEENDIRFLSLRLPEEAVAAIHAAEGIGFRLIESFLTFRCSTENPPPPDPRVRLARPEEAEAVADLAFRAFLYNRFLSDPLVPEEHARYSRREWVRNAFKGRAEAIYVVENEAHIVGFLLLKPRTLANGEKAGVIDLIAVAPEHSGRGLGSALVGQALRYYHGKAQFVEVSTQAKNIPSVALYTRNGFRLYSSEVSLHWHARYNLNTH